MAKPERDLNLEYEGKELTKLWLKEGKRAWSLMGGRTVRGREDGEPRFEGAPHSLEGRKSVIIRKSSVAINKG